MREVEEGGGKGRWGREVKEGGGGGVGEGGRREGRFQPLLMIS